MIAMRILAAIAASVSCAVFSARSQGSEEIREERGGAAPEKAASFKDDTDLRDPFWPVGYLPPSFARGTEEQTFPTDEQRKRALAGLRYGGSIRSAGKHYALVNGAMVQKGDVLTSTVNGLTFRFLVHEISMKGVELKPAD